MKKENSEGESSARDADFSKLEEENQTPSAKPAAAGSTAELDSVRAECQALKAEVKENHEKYLRALADLENFKKRSIKERSELLKYQGESFIVDLLEVVDNFERALENAQSHPEQLKDGVQLIHKMLADLLAKHGICAESAVGKKFEPQKHNALSQVQSAEAEPGTVVSELKKAYFYKDKLIRVGDVVVAAAAAQQEEEKPEQGGEAQANGENG